MSLEVVISVFYCPYQCLKMCTLYTGSQHGEELIEMHIDFVNLLRTAFIRNTHILSLSGLICVTPKVCSDSRVSCGLLTRLFAVICCSLSVFQC